MHILSAGYSDQVLGYTNHYHDGHELIYIISGEVEVSVSEKTFRAAEGTLLVFSRFEEHSVRVLSSEYRRYTLLISSEISRGSENYALSSILVNRSQGFEHIVDCGKSREKVRLLFAAIHSETNHQKPMYSKVADAFLMILLSEIYRIAPQRFLVGENKNSEMVRRIQNRFERDCSADVTIASLASEFHVSPSHLAHVFKSITGYSPIDYLISCRLSAAKNLLAESEKSIKEIVDACGFSDESNFSRTFKSKTGMTPSEFRRQNLRRSIDKPHE
ncbi:MAG: AraC family transcriptional regulator [Clostridia bacterium]|nr:AraC family transcriptional regulator [Clostridia bacterium]